MKNKLKQRKTRLITERLEPRMLYSADPLGLAVGAILLEDNNIEPNIQSFEPFTSLDTVDSNTDTNTSVDLIFIDIRSETNKATLQSLLASEHPQAIVYVIDPTEDGIETLSGVIASYDSVSSIHFLAHGDNQGLRLGTDWLDIDSVGGFASHLTSWQDSLTETADILLYGCNLTAGADGLQLIEELANYTGADIAASSDKTGHEDLNGDWDLESTTGKIETRSLGTSSIQQDWVGSLELISVSTADDVVDGDISSIAALKLAPGTDNEISLREAVIAANNTPGADEIELPVGLYHFDAITDPSNEDNALRGDLDIRDDLTIIGANAATTEINAQLNDRLFDVFGVDLTLQNLKLKAGEVNEEGGAIRVFAGTTTLDNVILEANQAKNASGGGVYVQDGTLIINNSTLLSNRADIDGGGVAGSFNTTVVINNSTLQDNDAERDGGGVAGTSSATVEINNSILFENDADRDGGGVAGTSSATVTINNSTLYDNDAVSAGGGVAGTSSATVVINNTTLYGNGADGDGAGVGGTSNANIEINNSIIHTNSADGDGGGISLENTGTVTLSGNHIYGNDALTGGGLISQGGASLDISATTFEANDANDGGGAYIDGDANIDSTTFSANTTNQDAAGLQIAGGTVDISHSTFTQNEVGNNSNDRADAIKIDAAATVTIGSTIIANNKTDTRDEVVGNFNSAGFNLSADTLSELDQPTDINNGTINLDVLSSTGGGPPTHTPLSGSDAIDSGAERAGSDANGADANFYADIGAVEFNPGTTANKLFWVDSSGWIYRANEDGTGVQQIFQTDLTPQDIQYDPVTNRIYWSETDGQYGQIRSTDVYGNNLQETPLSVYSDGAENPPSLMAPYGIAIDSANGIMYISANADQGTNSDLTRSERIYQYTINADGSIAYDSILYELNRLTTPPIHEIIDLHYEPDIDGRPMLVWTESGVNAVNDFFGNPIIPAVPKSVVFVDLNTDVLRRIVAVDDTITSTLAYDGVNQIGYLVNETSMFSYTIDHDAPIFTEIADDGDPQKVGVTFDTDNSLVWWTNDNGDIGYSDSALTIESTVISSVGTPGAITLGHIPSLDSPASIDVNTGLSTVTQGGSQTITQAMLHATDDYAADTDITYELIDPLAYGKLVLNGADIGPGSTFTQQQINDLELVYEHDGSEGSVDNLVLSVKDNVNVPFPDSFVFEISILYQNDFAPIANDESITVDENASTTVLTDGLTTSVLDNDVDSDGGEVLTASVKPSAGVTHGTLILNNDGTFTYTHDGSENLTDSFTYVVTDLGGMTDEATVSITINPVNDFAPVANADNITVTEGTAISLLDDGSTSSVLANDADADAGDTMTATVKAGFDVSHGTLVLATDGTFTYTHDGTENLTDSFTYVLTDSGGLTSEATVTITVTPVSDFDPVANDESIVVTEGTATSVLDDGSTTSVLANDTDADAGDTMSATVKPGFDVSHGTLVLATDGTFTYTHDDTENLSDSFTYVLTDAGGRTSEATVTITVTPVNDFDPVANDDSISVAEGAAISVLDDGSTTSILTNDTDADAGDSMSATVKAGFDVSHGTLALATDGTFTYTHDGSENLSDSFTYIVSDSGGRTSEATVNITITPVNDFAPVANADNITVAEGTAISLLDDGSTSSVLANDTDADAGDTMTATVKAGFDVSHGTLVLATDGTFTYTHDGTENLTDSFTYVLTDSGGLTSEATVTIMVTPVSDFDPVANADAINVDEGASVSVLNDGSTLSVLANDTDADTGDTMSAAVKTGFDVTHGTLVLAADGTFTYTHDDSENLTDQFTYILTDAGGRTAEATVTITINPVNNHAPIAIPESINVMEGGTATVQSNGMTDTVLGNDMDADAGDTMNATVKPGEDVQFGSLTLNTDGTFSYTHDGSENLYDTFTYIVTDSGGLTGEATVDIFVTGDNDNTPVLPADQLSINEGDTATQFDSGRASLLADIMDNDAGDSFTFSITTQPQYGTLTTNPDGSFSYSHDGSSEVREDSFSYTVTDAAGNESAVKLVNIAISNVNDAPVLNQPLDNFVAVERELFTQPLPADLFTDSEGDSWSIEINSVSGQMPSWLEFDAQTRILSGTPTGPDIGTYEFVLQARDSNNTLSIPVNFQIVVSESLVADQIDSTNLIISENTPGAVLGPLTLNGQAISDTTVVTTDDERFEFVEGVLALTPQSTVDYEQEPSISLTLTTTDDIGDEVSDVITIQTSDLNDTPEANQAPTTTEVPSSGELTLPEDLFVDQDQDALQYAAKSVEAESGELPDWLEFDEQNLTFSLIGTPTDTSLQVEITADDGNGGIATTFVNLQFDVPDLAPAEIETIEIENVDNGTTDEISEPEPEEEAAETQESANPVIALPADSKGEAIIEFEHIDVASLIKPLPRISAEAAIVVADYLSDLVEASSDSSIGEIKISNITIDSLSNRAINEGLSSLANSFDQQRELLEEAYEQSRSAIGRSITLTSGLSVGYLIWLIRGGTLMGSVLSSMPAWRLVDPLPILGSMTDDFEESEESLESMVENETE